jgi:hypothetical protein
MRIVNVLKMSPKAPNRGAHVITQLRLTPIAVRRRRETAVVVRTMGLREAGHLG